MAVATQAPAERRSRFMVDIALEIQRKGMLGFFESTWRRQGDQARVQIGSRQIFLVVHPDHVQRVAVSQRANYGKAASYDAVRTLLLGDGLVASNGALWRRQRKLLAPFFTPRAVRDLPAADRGGRRAVPRALGRGGAARRAGGYAARDVGADGLDHPAQYVQHWRSLARSTGSRTPSRR